MNSYFEDILLVEQPRNLNINLYRHQLASIYNMENIEEKKIIVSEPNVYKEIDIGILADIQGYGKTISVIALIVRDKMKWDMNVPYTFETINSMALGRIKTHNISKYDKINTNLVLVSPSMVSQWESELSKSNLRYASVISHKTVDSIEPMNYDVILIIPIVFNKYITMYRNMAWKRFIFDEPGHLRVSAMKPVIAGFYWFITATPCSIYKLHKNCKNSFIKELLCNNYYFDFEDTFKDIIIKNDPEFVKLSFEMPTTHNIYHDCYQPLYNVVNGFVSSSIHMMIEAGNIEGAILALGGDKTGNVVELVKRKKKEELEEIESKIRIYTLRMDTIKVNEWDEKKQQVCKQIKEIDKRFEIMLKDNCSICGCEYKSPILEPKCQNLFCGECLLKWLERKPSCPLCRNNIMPTDLVYIDSCEHNKVPEHRIKIKMTKVEKILDIVSANKDGKFLIFSSFDDSFTSITKMLNENGITNGHIKGTMKSRVVNIEKYKNGDIQVIFLNASYNGSGLNLQETTDIILYHEMNSNNLSQILGRANRIGRSIPLNVHHLKVQT